MKLIASLTSPYVRKVRIVLAEKKIDCDLVLDSPWVEGNQVAASNPLGKIPVLLLDDESPLYDSRVIAEYLDTVAPNNRLLPASAANASASSAGRRWQTAFSMPPSQPSSRPGAPMGSAVRRGSNDNAARSIRP